MNMREPTTMWDRAPTDAELGYTKSELAREQAEEHYKTLFSIAFEALSHPEPLKTELICLPYVSYRDNPKGKKNVYQIIDVIRDYSDYPKPEAALLEMLRHSKCPHVAAFKQALIAQYEESNLSELVEFDLEQNRE